MSYNCDICNYKTNDSGNFARHKKTKKHTVLAATTVDQKSIIESENDSDQLAEELAKISPKLAEISRSANHTVVFSEKKYICIFCEKEFKHSSSHCRHQKKCDKSADKLNSNNKEEFFNELKLKLEFAEKEKEIFKKLEQEKSEMLTNFMANANVLLNKANDNTKITAQTLQNMSMSALKYANEKFKDTPALLPLENFNINNLSFDNENDKKQLTEILIYNAKQKSLDKLLGDHIIKCYKKENPEEQSFHTTDCSRLNYIVRELIENAITWSVDKSGIKICSSIVKPLIEKCINLLLDHQKKLIDDMSLGDYSAKETVQTILAVLMTIDKGSLESEINKYIAPFFNLNKNN